MRAQGHGTFARPRGQAWGNDAQRAILHAIAEDVARRSGHRVAAIEVLRADGNLEFVAIAGSPEAREHLLGRASPLAMDKLVAFGTHVDGWVVIPEERVDDETRAWMAQYGHIPDLPASASPDAWRAEDRLVRLLMNDAGELRAVLYLDEPASGLRPTPESIAAINAEIRVMFEAVVSIVERERFGEQVRMLSQARTAIHGTSDTGIGISEADLDRVFTPFYRSGNPEARDRPGTGLGLPIIERVVTWHGGTIDVSSGLGAGTTFVVWLPGVPPDDPL